MELSSFDIAGIFVFFALAFFIYKKSWFFSFYSFVKFILLAALAFFAGIFIAKNVTLPLPLTQFQNLLILQALIFIILWRIVNLKRIFFAADRKILNLNRFFFIHRINRITSIIPAATAALFISFFLITTAVSASTSYPVLQVEIENSKVVKPIIYEVYFANLYDTKLLEGIAYQLVPAIDDESESMGIDIDKIGQDVLDSFREKIEIERGTRGLGPIVHNPPTNLTPAPITGRGGAGTFTPPVATPTQIMYPTITPINRPLFKIFPTSTPVQNTPIPTSGKVPTSAPIPTSGRIPTSSPANNAPIQVQPTAVPYKPPTPPVIPPVDTNTAEQTILRLTNEARANNGIGPLRLDGSISAVSRAHSRDMAERNFFSHNNPDGMGPFDRMRAGGISFNSAAENIAGGATAEIIVEGWMNSPGHRKNILNPTYSRIGIGVVEYNKYGILATQNFAD